MGCGCVSAKTVFFRAFRLRKGTWILGLNLGRDSPMRMRMMKNSVDEKGPPLKVCLYKLNGIGGRKKSV